MKSISIYPFLIVAILCVGCNSSDSSKNNTTAGETTATKSAPESTAATTPTNDGPKGIPSTGEKPASAGKEASAPGSIVGTWTTQGATFQFSKDGKMSVHASTPNGDLIEMGANYKLTGSKMSVHTTSMHVTAGPKDAPAMKQRIAAANAQESQTIKTTPNQVSTLAWQDKNTFAMTDQKGNSATLKRKD